MLPEQAVLTSKRFWSGQLALTDVANVCRQKKIDFVVLPKGIIPAEWKDLLTADYASAASDDKNTLFVSQRLLSL
jgi:hypothetical protein